MKSKPVIEVRRLGDYAKAMRHKMQNWSISDGHALTIREVEKMLQEANTPYSYEHIRRVLSGDLWVSQQCNNDLCKVLELKPDKMWNIARQEKLMKKYGSAAVSNVPAPGHADIQRVWDQLTDADKDILADMAMVMVSKRTQL